MQERLKWIAAAMTANLVDKERRLRVWKDSYEVAEKQYREDLIAKTARIEELERMLRFEPCDFTPDELLDEIKRRRHLQQRKAVLLWDSVSRSCVFHRLEQEVGQIHSG